MILTLGLLLQLSRTIILWVLVVLAGLWACVGIGVLLLAICKRRYT